MQEHVRVLSGYIRLLGGYIRWRSGLADISAIRLADIRVADISADIRHWRIIRQADGASGVDPPPFQAWLGENKVLKYRNVEIGNC